MQQAIYNHIILKQIHLIQLKITDITAVIYSVFIYFIIFWLQIISGSHSTK